MNKIDTYQARYSARTTKEYITNKIHESTVDFQSIISEAHDITLREASIKKLSFQDKNWMATTFNGNIIGLFKEYYRDLMKVDKWGRSYLQLEHDIRVYFKKMDDKYTPSNVRTNHVCDLWSQNIGSDLGGKIHIVYVGYVLDGGEWTKLKGIYASYPSNFYKKKIDWVVNMSDFAKVTKLPVNSEQSPEEIVITLKNPNEKTG